ncbi:MAG: endonuclease/exonuclease/phosphatase family protein [Cyclobacteriaceae bacterium]|nr:endonuclease/exonuclease/phosphatase family protein [Cyclobacteriaceae bacterium]MCB9239183.1 endonuclease/exonuclease/phosphatase family protein [Flammeovirgaceae bacterium]MCB0499891.1 endonuclease/exonuclease/phosphatase family protein [Cyclobacteriaceae bacterium]MCO5272667.1 endonuclease/exonuclease/phosphatase family protein [Cyclobacteriaceae bacterium]MCW5902796.1 endonuclease/exonuclease/phosphatase family protein [Cyclobacteriaceae bacterium]
MKPVVLLFMAACHLSFGQQQSDGVAVRVLSFNILHGATTKGDFDLDAIAKVINGARPDFVALQEVDYKTRRAKGYDLATELGWRTKLAPLFARAMEYDGGEYGEAVLSRYTFLATRNVPLPFSGKNEPRAALEITTVLPSGDTIAFIGTHLDHLQDDTDRVKQATEINNVFSYNTYPTLLAGDLNDVPGSTTLSILEQMWTPSYRKGGIQFTFPSDRPAKKIDYVMYYPKDKWKVLKTEVIADPIASDHCAYLVTLQLLR